MFDLMLKALPFPEIVLSVKLTKKSTFFPRKEGESNIINLYIIVIVPLINKILYWFYFE